MSKLICMIGILIVLSGCTLITINMPPEKAEPEHIGVDPVVYPYVIDFNDTSIFTPLPDGGWISNTIDCVAD